MNEVIRNILRLQGWYFTPQSVINFIRKEESKQQSKMKLSPVLGNPPLRVKVKK